MKILGLDLSITATGVARHDGQTYTIKPSSTGDRRLIEIRDVVHLAVGACDLVVIEDLPPIRAHALSILGMVHGTIRTALMAWGIPYVLVPPGSVKKYATGKGTATKPDMRMALFQRAGIDLRDDNQVDATWLRFMALDFYGHPVVDLPKAHRAALAKVQWPNLIGDNQ